jgi:very-short-patch-repair endonuclease
MHYRRRGYGYRRYKKQSDPAKYEKAKEMRDNPTKAEFAMWNIIRDIVYNNFPDYVFYRQSVQYGYILDFYCPRLRLGIEVDGNIHDTNEHREYDYYRDTLLSKHNIEIHRYSNDDVLYFPQETSTKIYSVLRYRYEQPVEGVVAREGCFIATAAFGTPMAKEINVLRRFRDQRLKRSMVGLRVVQIYYDNSPVIASIIAKSEKMRQLVRTCLKPIIWYLSSI